MELIVSFDNLPGSLKFPNDDPNPLFFIFWKFDELYFPSEKWFDFGYTVISWWLEDAMELLSAKDNSKIRFPFMDGPYALSVIKKGRNVTIRLEIEDVNRHSREHEVKLDAFISELVQAAGNIYYAVNSYDPKSGLGLKLQLDRLKQAARK